MLYTIIKILSFGPKVIIKIFKIGSTIMTLIKIISLIPVFLTIIAYILRIIENSRNFKSFKVSSKPMKVKPHTNLNSKITFNNKK
ncbi:MAG: hypothetical protein ACRCVG_07035 [Methanobacteriaceae archaeon]